MKPKFKKSYLATLGFLALIAQAVAIVTLHLKSHLIDHLIQKDAPWKYLIMLVALFAGLQIFGAMVNVMSENFNRFFSVSEFERYWNMAKPTNLQRSHVDNHHKLFNGLYNNIPKLFGLNISITLQFLTAVVYACFFIGRLVHDQFWMGLLFIPVIGLFSWGAGHLYSKSYQEGSQRVARDRVDLSAWLELWFRSSRERTFNWTGLNPKVDSWYEQKGSLVANGIRNHAKVVFKRDLFGSLLVDWPYIFCVTIVLVNVVQGHLTIGEFLIWTTLIDYLMSAFSSTRFIKKCRLDINALQCQLDEDLGWLSQQKDKKENFLPATGCQERSVGKVKEDAAQLRADFNLLSGESVAVGIVPGFYRIAGTNGSGKSTLIDTLIGFNDRFERWSVEEVGAFQRLLENHTRIVERETVIFPELNASLYTQIYMTTDRDVINESSKTLMVQKIYAEIPPAYHEFWVVKLEHLESLWTLRPGSLSSGEKVVLAFFRMIYSLNPSVKVIAIDECDSVLDQKTARIFQDTMRQLSQKYAIWYVSHTYQEREQKSSLSNLGEGLLPADAITEVSPLRPRFESHTHHKQHSYLSSIYLLGYEKNTARGFVTPCQVAALSGGTGEIIGTGNVGRALADVLIVVRRAMIHYNEHFRIFNHFDWQLDSVYREAEVGEIKSAGLALALAMIDIARQMKGLADLRGFAATGHVLLDGHVAPVAFVDEKILAASGLNFIKKVFSFRDINHIGHLVEMLLSEEFLESKSSNSFQVESIKTKITSY